MRLRSLVEAPAVIVSGRVARILEERLALNEFRMLVRGRDAELDDVLMSLHVASLQFVKAAQEEAASGFGFQGDGGVEVGARSSTEEVRRVSAAEVADAVNCSSRWVRTSASAGRLRGEVVAGRWLFTIEEVAAWAAVRPGGRNGR